MKAELRKDGSIWIKAENVVEAFAIQHLTPLTSAPCEKCGQSTLPVIGFDLSILGVTDHD